MKILKITTALALVFALAAGAPVLAKSSNTQFPGFVAFADEGYLLVFSSEDFNSCGEIVFCNSFVGMFPGGDLWDACVADGAPPLDLHWITTPGLADQVQFGGHMWVQIYSYESLNELGDFASDPCSFIGGNTPVAEGVANTSYTSADDAVIGPGVNSWSLNSNGLIESADLCGSDSDVRFKLVRRWVYFFDDELDWTLMELRASKGPSLKCRH